MCVWVEAAGRGFEWIAFPLAQPLVAFLGCGRSSQVVDGLCVHVFVHLHLVAYKCVTSNTDLCLCELKLKLLRWYRKNRMGHVGWKKKARSQYSACEFMRWNLPSKKVQLDGNWNFYMGPYFSIIKEGCMGCKAENSMSKGTAYEWCDLESRIFE